MMPLGATHSPTFLLRSEVYIAIRLSVGALIFENSRTSTSIYILKISISPSYKESTVNALASTADEGRG